MAHFRVFWFYAQQIRANVAQPPWLMCKYQSGSRLDQQCQLKPLCERSKEQDFGGVESLKQHRQIPLGLLLPCSSSCFLAIPKFSDCDLITITRSRYLGNDQKGRNAGTNVCSRAPLRLSRPIKCKGQSSLTTGGQVCMVFWCDSWIYSHLCIQFFSGMPFFSPYCRDCGEGLVPDGNSVAGGYRQWPGVLLESQGQ